MSKWYKIPTSSTMTEGDYRAGMNALNIVFGAVLGFVLVGGENLPTDAFIGLLLISALIVMLIQSIALSEYTLFSIVTTVAAIYFLPTVAEDWFSIAAVPKLQPTLAVWAGMAVILELSPRDQITEQTKSQDLQESSK